MVYISVEWSSGIRLNDKTASVWCMVVIQRKVSIVAFWRFMQKKTRAPEKHVTLSDVVSLLTFWHLERSSSFIESVLVIVRVFPLKEKLNSYRS